MIDIEYQTDNEHATVFWLRSLEARRWAETAGFWRIGPCLAVKAKDCPAVLRKAFSHFLTYRRMSGPKRRWET